MAATKINIDVQKWLSQIGCRYCYLLMLFGYSLISLRLCRNNGSRDRSGMSV